MPKIKMALVVEFDADQSDHNTIHLALDQILHLQPACSIVSKNIIEIDGTPTVGADGLSSAETIARYSRSSATVGPRDGVQGDSYRPDYSERSRDQLLDSYRPGTLDGHGASSRGIDSYRPNGKVSSDPAAIHPDRQKIMTRSDETIDFTNEGGGLSSSAVLGTRYDALVEDIVFTPNSQPTTNNNSSYKDTRTRRSSSHYSPPPARDRSASPQNGWRRSERLRTAPSRNRSEHETSHKTKLERWKQRRDEEMKRLEAARGSLEFLAPLFSDKGRFERQREIHGITEALRLKNLRTNHKIEKAKRQLDKRRWGGAGEKAGGGEEVKQGARMDAVIEQIASFDFSAPSSGIANGDGSAHSATHPPVETRKKKGAGARKRGRGKSVAMREKESAVLKRDNDDEMHDVHPHPPPQTQTQTQAQQLWEQQMKSQASSTSMADMAVDDGAECVNVLGGSSSSSGAATNAIPATADAGALDEEGVA
ncbi:hypothetical protein EPUS_05908 [Endocarpon pusillum Z07020]|uniref:Uncharacterized protein n=1 Tax=Endocarpon pusillum (strain Z07020 / HMAS-L-300199) TaxID=1263415 RepID=U1GPK7_ENDPU|nr:uncharacterized protein EPUS_05908 [Endocarpon pusillum Z07020]ERF73896.1 hypothetical protein EPUS_05908 [Endocarpon pusillum Z07020]